MEIYRGRRLWIEDRTIILPNGREKSGIIVHPGDAVVILPRSGDGYYLIRQYRFAIGSWIYEVPAGTMESGEEPQQTARRELIEETGFDAKTIVSLGFIYTTPGFTDEKIWLFEADDLAPSREFLPDDDEMIEVVRFPITEILRMIRSGEIVDAKTMAVILRSMEMER